MNKTHQKGFGWPHVLFALVLGIILVGLFTPIILRPSPRGPRTEVLNNAKAIAGGLAAFKEEYGAYPCPETRELLRKKGYDTLTGRDDANAYLAQLVVTEIIDSETYFYAAGVKNAIKGDDFTGSQNKLLSKGENSFIYIMAEDRKPLKDVPSFAPIVMAPIKARGEIPVFDKTPYAGYYVYGRVDGSGGQGKIGPTGLPLSKGRTHLFQTGTDSLFRDEIPVVKYPLGF